MSQPASTPIPCPSTGACDPEFAALVGRAIGDFMDTMEELAVEWGIPDYVGVINSPEFAAKFPVPPIRRPRGNA